MLTLRQEPSVLTSKHSNQMSHTILEITKAKQEQVWNGLEMHLMMTSRSL